MKKLILVALLSCFALSAYAVTVETEVGTVDLYSSLRAVVINSNLTDSDYYRDYNETKIHLQTNSRAGIRWRMDNVFAHAEWRFDVGDRNTTLGLMYAGYDFEEIGSFKIGYFNNVADAQDIHNRKFENENGVGGFGAPINNRRLGIGWDYGNLQVTLTSLKEDSGDFTDLVNGATGTDVDTVRFIEAIPKIEVAYTIEPADLKLFAAFASFSADAAKTSDPTESKKFDATAYHAGFGYSPKFGDAFAALSAFYAVNAGLYSEIQTSNGEGGSGANVLPTFDGSDIEDVSTYGFGVSFGYKFTPTVTAEIGGGYQNSTYEADGYEDDANMGFYANCMYRPSRNIMITPEVNYIDFGKDGKDMKEGKVILAGVQFRVDI